MTRKLLATTAIIALSAGVSLAQSASTDQIVAQLQEQGFTRIEIEESATEIEVEAIMGETKVEYVYDAVTGELLEESSEAVDADDDTDPGVFVTMDDEDDDEDDDRDDEDGEDDEDDEDEDQAEGDDEEDEDDENEDEDDEDDD